MKSVKRSVKCGKNGRYHRTGVVKNRWYGETSRGGFRNRVSMEMAAFALKLIKETRFLVRWLSTTCNDTPIGL